MVVAPVVDVDGAVDVVVGEVVVLPVEGVHAPRMTDVSAGIKRSFFMTILRRRVPLKGCTIWVPSIRTHD